MAKNELGFETFKCCRNGVTMTAPPGCPENANEIPIPRKTFSHRVVLRNYGRKYRQIISIKSNSISHLQLRTMDKKTLNSSLNWNSKFLHVPRRQNGLNSEFHKMLVTCLLKIPSRNIIIKTLWCPPVPPLLLLPNAFKHQQWVREDWIELKFPGEISSGI